MSVFASLLVLVSILCLAAGIAMSSAQAYTAAAISSAVAVLLLWRYLRVTKDRTFITDAPAVVLPDFDKPLHGRTAPRDDVLGLDAPEVAIDDYDSLMAAEILPSLETLSAEELEAVVAREKLGLQRQGVMARAQRLIDLTRSPDVDLSDKFLTPSQSVPAPEAAPPTVAKRTRRKPAEKSLEKKKPDLSL